MSDQARSASSNESTGAASGDPGLVRLMGTTPLRDVVRGRLTGRLDISRACADAGLPPELESLVLRTVRATRLWRIEKADVASELIAHFRDGLAAGRTPDELISTFGDPAVAARLMRSTKMQSRPLPWKLWILSLKAAGAIVLLSLICYTFLFIRYHTGHSTLTINVINDLNAPVHEIPTEQRAWSQYKLAIRDSVRFPDNLALAGAQWPLVPADSPHRPAALAYLEQNRDSLEIVHAAARLPRLGYILSDRVRPDDPWYNPADAIATPDVPAWKDNPPAFGILLPSLGEFRKFSHLLMFDSLLARERGDSERAARNIHTVIAMAEHTRELPFLISDLVALALIARACEDVNTTIHDAPDLLSEAQLVSLAHALAAFPRDGGPLIRYESEALGFEDALQRVYTDDGRGNGRVNADGVRFLQTLAAANDRSPLDSVVDPLAVALIADRATTRREYNLLLNEAITAARTPVWTWTEAPEAAIQAREQDFMWRRRFPLIHTLMFAISQTAKAQHRFSQTRDATLAVISLTLAKRQTGSYPASLSELTPTLLPAVPLDIFDGAPLRYALVNESPVLYSVGVDRKDDGGRPPKNPHSGLVSTWKPREQVDALMAVNSSREPIDGDWVLYPPLPPLPPPPPEGADE